MKQCLIHAVILLCLFNNAYAKENDWQLSLHVENMENGNASSFRINTGDFLYGGLSLNYIDSDTAIQDRNRKTIYPVFLFMGIKYPAKFTPFFEAAVDLPEVIFDELFDDENNSIDLTDYYLSGGVDITISDRLTVSLFSRKYVFKYHETTLDNTIKVRANSYGAGITMRF